MGAAVVILVLWALAIPVAAQAVSNSAAVAFTAAPGAMAEAAIAVDPADVRHLAAAADPYGGLVRIRLATSVDGGAAWSPPRVLVPPGFAKSYDPVLSFDSSGAVLVVGGASGVGQPSCQPGSAVFIAIVKGGAVTYRLIRDTRGDGDYVDRPGFTLSAAENRAYVTWTESSGPGAACRGTPVRSTVMIASGLPSGSFSEPVVLPTSGLPGPFGATPVLTADGSVLVAVGEHGPAQQSRISVTSSADRGHTFSRAEIVLDGTSPANSVRGVSGFVAAVPSIAVDRSGRIAIAFSQAVPGNGVGAVVVERTTGSAWRTISPPTQAGTAELLPQVVYDPAGVLWLLSARASGGFIDLALRRRATDWEAPITLARGSSDRYLEVGEALGLVAIDDMVIAAAPINRTADSAMVVASHRSPPPEPPPTTTTTRPRTSTTGPAVTERAPPPSSHPPASRATPPLAVAVAVGVAGAAALAVPVAFARRRRTKGDP